MFRSIRRYGRRLLCVRARAALLLITWVASVVLTVVHDDDGVASPERSAASTSGAAPQRSVAAVGLAAHGPTMAALCRGAGGCHDPSHHHRPPAHHDVTQCPYCAMLLERPAELPLFVFVPPATIRFVGADVRALLSSSERGVFALARGPPEAGAPV